MRSSDLVKEQVDQSGTIGKEVARMERRGRPTRVVSLDGDGDGHEWFTTISYPSQNSKFCARCGRLVLRGAVVWQGYAGYCRGHRVQHE